MEAIYIDTALLAVPNYCSEASAASEIFNVISRIASVLMSNIPILIVVADNVEQDLWGNNLGPNYEILQEFIDIMELSHVYTAHDLFRMYSTVLERSTKETSACSLVVKSTDDFLINPDILIDLFPQVLLTETRRQWAGVAALVSAGERWSFCAGIAPLLIDTINVGVKLKDAKGERLNDLGPLPVSISATIPIFSSLADLISISTSERFWRGAKSASCLHFSITLGALALLKQSGGGKVQQLPLRFAIGSKFLDSLINNQSHQNGRFSSVIREICSQLIAGNCAKAIGQFGRPNQQTRSFDGAKGWRVHATKGSEGLRLMYWEVEGHLEFANIGVKHELLIEPGTKGSAIKLDYIDLLLEH